MAKEDQKISAGRIVLVVVGVAIFGEKTTIVKRPAIVTDVAASNDKTGAPQKIKAHVFMDGAKDGDWSTTQFRDGLTYEAEAKTFGTWSWPPKDKADEPKAPEPKK